MKMKFLSILMLTVLTLQSSVVRADGFDDDEVEAMELNQVTEQLQKTPELTGEDIFDQISESSEVAHLDSETMDTVFTASSCLSSYETRHKQLKRKSIVNAIIAPFGVAAATTVVGAYGGSYVGPVLTGSDGYGAILGSAWGAVIMFYGSVAFFTTREAILVSEYIQMSRMILLLKEVHSEQPLNELLMLTKLQEKLAKKEVNISLIELKSKIIELDQKGSLCDGLIRGNEKSKKLRKKLVSFRLLQKTLSAQ